MSPLPLFFFCYFFPGIFILVGAFVFYNGLKEMFLARRSVGWPTAPGTIQSSGVRIEETEQQRSAAFDDVKYTYLVYDISYTSDRVLFADYGTSDAEHANRIAGQYHEGQGVTVYYNPAKPSESVLTPGFNNGCYVLPGVGGIFMVLGTLVLFFIPLVLTGNAGAPSLSPENNPVNLVNPVQK